MSARQPLAAGVIVASLAALVLLGWTFDITTAKSLMAGWRVMVPVTAASFFAIAVALIVAARGTHAPVTTRTLALLALVLPLISFIEYLTGARTGVENWFGVRFDAASTVAGRMSPLTSVCLLSLGVAASTATALRARWMAVSRIASGATLLTAWLALLAVAFDIDRLADAPRFPGMAVLTIALFAVAGWGTLSLSLHRDRRLRPGADRPSREAYALALAFIVPVLVGWLRDSVDPSMPQQVVNALLVFLLSAALSTIVWVYGTRMAQLRRERERALGELERRVDERTSELATRNADLRVSEGRLRHADRRKDEFLATLAHELRNPLAPIRTAVAILKSDLVSDAERREARAIIDRQVAHMARLIDDLLDVSRIAAGKLPMRRTHLPLNRLLEHAVATVQPHIDQARHRLIVSVPGESVIIDGDESRLSQVFANLLHNACKYTEPGGEIVVSASLPNDHEVLINVRDNGIGIPAEFLPHVFEKFSQVAPAQARSQGGLGLGLSLVHGIVFAHGGCVEARSRGPGCGSEFIVQLPIVQGGLDRAAGVNDSPGITQEK
jgi:signal transduction histidine kinase